MLGAVRQPGFSKTARSHPGHREARWDGHRDSARAVRDRSLAHDVVKRAAEGAEAGEADVEADVRHAARSLDQQEHCPLDTAALKVAVRRLTKRGAKGPDEMRLRDAGDLGEAVDVERVRVRPVNRIAGTEHAAIALFHGPAHGFIRPRSERLMLGAPGRN